MLFLTGLHFAHAHVQVDTRENKNQLKEPSSVRGSS